MKKTGLVACVTALVVLGSVSAVTAADGKQLYSSKCAMCHGADGVPKKTAAGSKSFIDPEFKKSATAEAIVGDIKNGKGKMKPVKISEDEAKAIAEYILAMAPAK